MKKIIQWGQACLKFFLRYKRWLVVALVFSLVVFGLLYGIFFGRLWLKFPEKFKVNIALNRLGVSSYQYPVCHETCFYERQLYEQVIAGGLKDKSISDRVRTLILAEDNNLIFRLELINALSLQNNPELPDYLQEYLRSGVENKIKDKIRELFGVDKFSVSELENRFVNSSSTEDRLVILNSLQKKSDSALAGFYLDLIVGDPDLKIKSAALAALSNLLPSENYVDKAFLQKIKNLIFNPNTNKYLRKEIILLLGEYLPIQEESVTEILVEVCADDAGIDKFSRLFAVDILNRLSANTYLKPEISASEWQEYRDHNSLWGND